MELPLWRKRIRLEQWIREFFWSLDYEETHTPLLVKSPGMEPHIKPIEVKEGVFLPTSPEFAMKKLLARGMPRIFQICSSFRDEPYSPDHSPEFSMLEFYEAEIALDQFQIRVESLFRFLIRKAEETWNIAHRPEFHRAWKRFQINTLFQEIAGLDLRKAGTRELSEACTRLGIPASESEPWDDLYFKIWLNQIEPALPKNEPFFVTHYPLSQSSLCNSIRDEQGFAWANRFEIYYGALELGNAFDELRDADQQRKNFIKDQTIRKNTYGNKYPTSPMDEELLMAIENMPPTCGIAIGVDRMAKLILQAKSIHDVIPLPTHWNSNGSKGKR